MEESITPGPVIRTLQFNPSIKSTCYKTVSNPDQISCTYISTIKSAFKFLNNTQIISELFMPNKSTLAKSLYHSTFTLALPNFLI